VSNLYYDMAWEVGRSSQENKLLILSIEFGFEVIY